MNKFLAFVVFCSKLLAVDEIGGFWKSLNDDTGVIQCVVAVYPYQDKFYGRIVSTYDENGKMKESIYHPEERAPGIAGNPFYCGLDLIWDLEDYGSKYKGKIVDPEKGNVYNSEVWVDDGNLIVRGKLLFFGRSVTWYPIGKEDFPANFKKPNVAEFVPEIPQVN